MSSPISFLGESTASRSVRVWSTSSPPTVVSGCPSVPCCRSSGFLLGVVYPATACPVLSLPVTVVPRGRPIPGFPGVIPRSRFVWTLPRSLGHAGLSSVWAGLPAALAGGAARSLTWSGGANHAAPLPCKSRDGSGQRIGLSQVTYPARRTAATQWHLFPSLNARVCERGCGHEQLSCHAVST